MNTLANYAIGALGFLVSLCVLLATIAAGRRLSQGRGKLCTLLRMTLCTCCRLGHSVQALAAQDSHLPGNSWPEVRPCSGLASCLLLLLPLKAAAAFRRRSPADKQAVLDEIAAVRVRMSSSRCECWARATHDSLACCSNNSSSVLASPGRGDSCEARIPRQSLTCQGAAASLGRLISCASSVQSSVANSIPALLLAWTGQVKLSP